MEEKKTAFAAFRDSIDSSSSSSSKSSSDSETYQALTDIFRLLWAQDDAVKSNQKETAVSRDNNCDAVKRNQEETAAPEVIDLLSEFGGFAEVID